VRAVTPRGNSAKGAKCESLGQRPRVATVEASPSAEGAIVLAGARHPFFVKAIARLQRFLRLRKLEPGALPQAVTFRAFGAETVRFHPTRYRDVVLTSFALAFV